jgi:hypothetical protein
MKKKDSLFFLIVVLYLFIVVFFFLYFVSFSNTNPVKIYNVEKPSISVSNDYAISLNEQIKQNLYEIKNAFLRDPNFSKLNIDSVSSFIHIKINGVSGEAPNCGASVSTIKDHCTTLNSVYSSLKPYINNLKISFTSSNDISNYYIFKYNNSYYFMDNSFYKTINNNGFPIYYIKG